MVLFITLSVAYLPQVGHRWVYKRFLKFLLLTQFTPNIASKNDKAFI
jgi:hypothetical protein